MACYSAVRSFLTPNPESRANITPSDDTGVISATLVSVGTSLSEHPLTTVEKSLIAASTSLFALFVSPISGQLANTLGRKRVILLSDLLFIFGALLQAFAGSVAMMVVGRSVIGLAVGAASFATPLYIAELSPSMFRGRLVTLNVLFITLGQVIAYIMGWGFAEGGSKNGWRWLVGLGALPAALQCLVMVFMPESPRWLIQVGRVEEAKGVLKSVYGTEAESRKNIKPVLKAIKKEVRGEEEAKRDRSRQRPQRIESWYTEIADSWSELFGVPGNARALTIACLLQGLQQLCGFVSRLSLHCIIPISSSEVRMEVVVCDNHVRSHDRSWAMLLSKSYIVTLISPSAPLLPLCVGRVFVAHSNSLQNSLMYFSATLFSLLGFATPTLTSLSVACTNFIFTIFSLLLIDRFGRRGILLLSIPIMSLALFCCAITFHFIDLPDTTYPDTIARAGSSLMPVLVVLFIILYVASYALGLGNVPWQQSELFPLSVRSLGSSISTAMNWASNFAVGITFLQMLDGLGPSGTFAVYGVVCAVGWLAVWFIYPETKGLSLEETGELLKDGWGVRERPDGEGYQGER